MADWTGLVTNSNAFYSGININQVVSALVQADSAPLTNLQNQITQDNAEISAYGSILSQLSTLNTLALNMEFPSIYGYTATSSNTNALTATADSTATAASYSITINNVAQAQSIYSAAFATTSTAVAVSGDTGFELVLGSGASQTTITISYDSTNNDFYVGGATSVTYANNWQGVEQAINAAASSITTVGVTASIINNGSADQLVVSSNSTGAADRMQILVYPSGGTGYGGANGTAGINQLAFDPSGYSSTGLVTGWTGTENMQQGMAGLDASFVLNGISITNSANSITSVINGVTLNLLEPTTSPAMLTVGHDNAGFTTEIQSFITAYNSAMGSITTAMGLTTASVLTTAMGTTSTVMQTGPLYDDWTTVNLQTQLENLTTQTYNGTTLANLGITHDSNGNLTLNTATFSAALAANPSQALGAINAMATSLASTLGANMYTFIPDAENSLNAQNTAFTQQENTEQENLNNYQQMLLNEFIAMEQYMGQMNQYSSAMSGTSSSGGTTA